MSLMASPRFLVGGVRPSFLSRQRVASCRQLLLAVYNSGLQKRDSSGCDCLIYMRITIMVLLRFRSGRCVKHHIRASRHEDPCTVEYLVETAGNCDLLRDKYCTLPFSAGISRNASGVVRTRMHVRHVCKTL